MQGCTDCSYPSEWKIHVPLDSLGPTAAVEPQKLCYSGKKTRNNTTVVQVVLV